MSVSLNRQSQVPFHDRFQYDGFNTLDTNFLISSYGTNYQLVYKMFEAFLDSNVVEVPILREAVKLLDFKKIKFSAHKIKNNFYYVGLGSVSKLLAEIEKKSMLESNEVIGLFEKFQEQHQQNMEVVKNEQKRLSKHLSEVQ